MKRFNYSVIIFLALLALLAACKRENISDSFAAQPAVYFIYNSSRVFGGDIDQLSYSFVSKGSEVTRDTIWLPVRITGSTADHDRTVALVPVSQGTTAVKDVHYKLLDYKISKNSFRDSLGVVLLRDASLRDTAMTLHLRIQPTSDFPVLMQDTLMGDGLFYSRSEVKIKFTDRLLKPDDWESYLIIFFGDYSQVKLRFMTVALGVYDFPTRGPNALSYPTLQYYQNAVRNALAEYNSTHGSLRDENGNPVVFP